MGTLARIESRLYANRGQLQERLEAMLRDARRAGSVLSMALADVDHFQGIADRFSAAVADEVLRRVDAMLRARCRDGDMAGRYGGDDFVLIFRNTEMRAAAEACEALRREVEAIDWAGLAPQLRVTLSVGLASSESLDTAEAMLDAANHWLDEAKHHGRNQVQPRAMPPA